MLNFIRKLYLSCKYYLQGDTWEDAWGFAETIVDGFKKPRGGFKK